MADPSNSISTMGDLILGSRKSMLMSSSASLDNVLSATASLGLSVAVVRWLLNMYRRPAVEAEETGGSDEKVVVVQGGMLDAIMSTIRRSLRRLLLDAEELEQYESVNLVHEVHVVDGAVITHQGSCHCRSVRFEIRAPRTLVAKEGPGKIQYRHTETKSSNFRVVRGQSSLKTYYVKNLDDRGAHAFCDRCGCHVLFAPSKNSTRLQINVNCIDEGIRKIKVVDTKSSLSNGTPLEEQWDDQLTTISEVSQDPYYFRQTQFQDALSADGGSTADWRLYDEVDKLDPAAASQRKYFAPPHTPTTVDSLTGHGTDAQSLPPFRISRFGDTASVMTDSDMFSVTRSEFRGGVTSPSKPMPLLHDQMKYYMKKHVSPNSKAAENQTGKEPSNQ
jgi:hypothetical protein